MILFQLIAIELLQYSNDYAFAQFLISTFICPASDLSSFKYAKEKYKITKKHTFMPFQQEWSSVALPLNGWVVSFAFLVFSPLPWNVHPQIEVVKTGGCHRSTHLHSRFNQQDLFVAHTCEWEQEKEEIQKKGLLQPWLFERFYIAMYPPSTTPMADPCANENKNPKEWFF